MQNSRFSARRFFSGACAAAVLVPASARAVHAHVKWFVPDEEALVRLMHQGPVYGPFEPPVLAWAALSAVILLAARFLDALLPVPERLTAFAARSEGRVLLVFQALIGLFLVYIALVRGIVLVPELAAASAAARLLQAAEVVAGALLLTNTAPRAAAVLLLGLYAAGSALAGWTIALENVLLAGVAGYIFIMNTACGPRLARCQPYAVPFLRVCAGVSLAVIAFTDKLLFPELAYVFLQTHNWNFMKLLGVPGFSDQLFILCAGVTELLFGIVYILGYVTRINTAVMASFFLVSVVAMAAGFGRWEVEDLPIYAVAMVLLLYGSGRRPAERLRLAALIARPGPLKNAAAGADALLDKYLG